MVDTEVGDVRAITQSDFGRDWSEFLKIGQDRQQSTLSELERQAVEP
jgi:hypothetical protein